MPSLNNQLTAAALKYLGGEAVGGRSAEAIWRKAMTQYLGGGSELGRLSLNALAERTARQYLGDNSKRSLDNLLLRWAYAVAGVGAPGKLSLQGAAMRALDKYLNAAPPSPTYDDFVAHITSTATGGALTWGATDTTAAGTFRTTAATPSDFMHGSPWMTEIRPGWFYPCSLLRHGMVSQAAFDAQVSNGGQVMFRTIPTTSGNVLAVDRNGFLSTATASVSRQRCDLLVFWDFTLGKAQQMNPYAGTGPVDYTWVP